MRVSVLNVVWLISLCVCVRVSIWFLFLLCYDFTVALCLRLLLVDNYLALFRHIPKKNIYAFVYVSGNNIKTVEAFADAAKSVANFRERWQWCGFFLAFLRLVSLEEIILILMKFKMFNAFLNFVNLFIINYVHWKLFNVFLLLHWGLPCTHVLFVYIVFLMAKYLIFWKSAYRQQAVNYIKATGKCRKCCAVIYNDKK